MQSIIEKLSHHQPALLPETSPSAAVLVLLLTSEIDEVSIVLTKRAPTLLTYAGDYSFPGGMRDPEDRDLYTTAMRETFEELSIVPNLYQEIGQLDDFQDHHSHLVRPYVAMMKRDDFTQTYKISPDEIANIYLFSLSRLNQIQDTPSLHIITRRRPSYSFTEGDVFVWGLTASILVHFANVIFDQKRPLGRKFPTVPT